jgi:hypothetical protein
MKKLFLALMLVLAFTATAFAQLIPEGEYVIRSAQSYDYALTLKDGNASDANTVHFWRWRNDNSQKWKVTHQNGKIVIRSMVNNNYVLDVKGYNYSNNAEVYIYTYHGGNNQLWIPESAINGSYILKTAGDPNYCLDLKNGVAKNDNKVELWQVHKKFQQRWIFEKASKMPKPIQNASSNIADGEYVIKFAKNPDYVLTLKNGNASNTNLVHLWKWKNDNSQKWKVTHTNGKIVIRSMVNNNYVLDVTGYAYTDDTQIQIYEYHGADNQLWIPEQLNNGSYALMIAGNPDYCLDLDDGITKNNNVIQIWRAHKGFQQQWLIEKAPTQTNSNGIAGVYDTDFSEMTLQIDGKHVTGTYKHSNGRIDGTLSGHTLTGRWTQSNGEGRFVFEFNSDFSAFTGKWDYNDAEPSSRWNGTKKKNTTPNNNNNSTVTPVDSPSIAGVYDTDFNEMTLQIDGKHVTGTYKHSNGRIDGTLSGHTLTGRWTQSNGQGRFVFEFNSDFSAFTGKWSYNDAEPSSRWNGTKK